jgi:hypothetical protein
MTLTSVQLDELGLPVGPREKILNWACSLNNEPVKGIVTIIADID